VFGQGEYPVRSRQRQGKDDRDDGILTEILGHRIRICQLATRGWAPPYPSCLQRHLWTPRAHAGCPNIAQPGCLLRFFCFTDGRAGGGVFMLMSCPGSWVRYTRPIAVPEAERGGSGVALFRLFM